MTFTIYKNNDGIGKHFVTNGTLNELPLITAFSYSLPSGTTLDFFSYYSSATWSCSYTGTNSSVINPLTTNENTTSTFTKSSDGLIIDNAITFKVPTNGGFTDLLSVATITYTVTYNFNFGSFDTLASIASSLNQVSFNYLVKASSSG